MDIFCGYLQTAYENFRFSVDEFVKSRHSGENRSPDGPQLLENTGFRLSPE
jgi:hypothetical protein